MGDNSFGYLATIKPMSQSSAEKYNSNENIKATVKTSISTLCSNLFDSRSDGHDILKQFAKGSTRYETNLSVDTSQDRTKTHLAIHKYYEEIKNNLPQIVIADGGCLFKSPGLGFHTGVRKLSTGMVAHEVMVIRELPIMMNIVTMAQQDTERLTQVLQLYWGDLVGLIHGYRISGGGEGYRWHIHLPKVPDFGTVDKTSIDGDPIKQIWSSIITMQCTYESTCYIIRNDISSSDVVETAPSMIVNFPASIRIGRKVQGTVSGLDPACKVITSDDENTKMLPGEHWFQHYILARKPCTFKIQVVKPIIDQNREGHLNGPLYTILAEKQITATY